MNHFRSAPLTRPLLLAISALSLFAGAGCPSGNTNKPSPDGNVGIDPSQYPGVKVEGEPNDTFAESVEVIFSSAGGAQLAGTLPTTSDVDVYSLGPMNAGDRIIVDVGTAGNGLDADVAIFDETGDLVMTNDDRNLELNQLDPFINFTIRHDSSVYFLAICSSPLGPSTGADDIQLTRVLGGAVPATSGQIVATVRWGHDGHPGRQVVHGGGVRHRGDLARLRRADHRSTC